MRCFRDSVVRIGTLLPLLSCAASSIDCSSFDRAGWGNSVIFFTAWLAVFQITGTIYRICSTVYNIMYEKVPYTRASHQKVHVISLIFLWSFLQMRNSSKDFIECKTAELDRRNVICSHLQSCKKTKVLGLPRELPSPTSQLAKSAPEAAKVDPQAKAC